MNRRKVLAGIVTYNPSIDRVRECLSAILLQVDDVFIFDNGSDNIQSIEELLSYASDKIILFKNNKNDGIAKGLSTIMKYASDNAFTWVLSMDQDSILLPGTIEQYLTYSCKRPDAGLFTCLIKDRNFVDIKNEKQDVEIKEVDTCITSGSFMNVEAYNKTSGYDVDFFIDCVDFDICYSLREMNFSILRVNHIGLLHEVGRGEIRRFLWKTIIVYHESPTRVYYYARNTKRLYRKHKKFNWFMMLKKEMALLIRILLYEENKRLKLKCFFKGISDKPL